jgi:hypothetical protein
MSPRFRVTLVVLLVMAVIATGGWWFWGDIGEWAFWGKPRYHSLLWTIYRQLYD